MRLVCIALVFCCTSCKVSTFYPLAGAAAGGGAGALAGPVPAALGAGAGYAAGELAKGSEEIEEAREQVHKAQQTIQALTKGDVQALLDQQLQEAQKGWADRILDEVWGILKLAALGGLLYIVVPIIYSRYQHSKLRKDFDDIRSKP